MNKPLQAWQCDECGGSVGVADGRVVWGQYTDPDFQFKLVHQDRCDDHQKDSSLPLKSFLGSDGLIALTCMLSYGLMHWSQTKRHFGDSPPLDIWVDFVRRMQVPYYEESRDAFRTPATWDCHAAWNEVAPYLQANLERLAKKSMPHAGDIPSFKQASMGSASVAKSVTSATD